MRQHENRLRRALVARNEARILHLRTTTTDVVKSPEAYITAVAQIQELRRMNGEIGDICEKILDEEFEGDD